MKTGSSTEGTFGQSKPSRKEVQEGRLMNYLVKHHRLGYVFLTLTVLSVLTAVLVPTLYSGKIPGIDQNPGDMVAGGLVGGMGSLSLIPSYFLLSQTKERLQSQVDTELAYAIRDNKNITEWLHKGAQDNLELAIHRKEHMQAMFDDGAELSQEEGVRLLHLSIQRNAETVDLFLERGIDPNTTDREGNTALHIAARTYFDLITKIIPKMKECDQKNKKGETPLMLAAERGCPASVQALINAHADVNATTVDRQTPLMKAASASYKNDDVITLLLKHGARVEDEDAKGKRALHYSVDSVTRGITNISPFLKAKAQLNV